MECMICGEESGMNNIRLGVCWYCAEAESVIEDGTDMEDNIVAETSMEKLKWLIEHRSWNNRNKKA